MGSILTTKKKFQSAFKNLSFLLLNIEKVIFKQDSSANKKCIYYKNSKWRKIMAQSRRVFKISPKLEFTIENNILLDLKGNSLLGIPGIWTDSNYKHDNDWLVYMTH